MLTANQSKILIIGNSHSVDAFWQLSNALRDLIPGMEPVLGVVYYSGCSITRHIQFGTEKEPAYRYYKNVAAQWDIREGYTLDTMLRDEAWDIIFLQAAKSDLDDTLNREGRRALEAFVNERVRTPHQFLWHTSWPSPNDETFFSPTYVRQPPAGYKERLTDLYGFNPINQFTILTSKAKEHILTDETYPLAVCTGAGIMHAHFVLGVPQTGLWRDYTHQNDFGRLVAAYTMAAQLAGKPVEQVSVDAVPVSMRHKQYQALGNLTVTDEMKQIIIRAANYALQDPWTVPTV